MGGTEISIESNSFALEHFSSILHDIEHFVFFGSLLGLCRGGKPIDGDDDIDIYVDQSQFERLISTLVSNNIFIDFAKYSNQTSYYFQFDGVVKGIHVRVDFYFYEKLGDFIVDKWNFFGDVLGHQCAMHVPSALIFPLQLTKFRHTHIFIPACPEQVCEFLYGSTWKVPQKKGSEYKLIMRNQKPVFIPVSKLNMVDYYMFIFLVSARKLISKSLFVLKSIVIVRDLASILARFR